MRISSSYILIFFHAIVWAAILFFPFFIADPDTGYTIGAIPGAFFSIAGLIHLIIFYVNAYYLFPTFFNRRTWWLYVLLAAMLLGASLLLKNIILHAWFPEAQVTPVANRIIFAPSFGIYVVSIVYRKILD